MATTPKPLPEAPRFSPAAQAEFVVLDIGALQRRLEPAREDAAKASSLFSQRVAAAARLGAVPSVPSETNRPVPTAMTIGRSFGVQRLVREQQGVRADLLAEQLELALDALLECKLGATAGDLGAQRRLLFDLYEAGVVTKGQVRRRGRLEPSQFHEELRAHRMRMKTR